MKTIRNWLASTAEQFGIHEEGKLSARGLAGFSYQVVALVLMTCLALFFLPDSVMAVGLLPAAILAVGTTVSIIIGTKILISVFYGLSRRIAAAIDNKALEVVTTSVVLFAFALLIFMWPGVFFWGVAKALPHFIAFPGWKSALASGIAVLAADTILGGLTGVSLMVGKGRKAS